MCFWQHFHETTIKAPNEMLGLDTPHGGEIQRHKINGVIILSSNGALVIVGESGHIGKIGSSTHGKQDKDDFSEKFSLTFRERIERR